MGETNKINKTDKSSNEVWIDADNYDDFETTRPVLFRDDMREMFFKWFRIKPSDNVLVGGCGPGVEVRFIARGLDGITGKVTGFDISKSFVEYGGNKIKSEGLSDKAKIVLDDGFNLSFADNTFDVVVNHMYLGVLSDPVAGLKEMIRVCKAGGNISASTSGKYPGISHDSDSGFKENERLKEVGNNYHEAYQKIMTPTELKQSEYWSSPRYPKMFLECGLKNITINPYAAGFSYSDGYWSDGFKVYKIKAGLKREIECLEENKKDLRFGEYGFSTEDFDELIELNKHKQEYLLNNLGNNQDWEWSAGSYYIVSGTKTQ